MHIWLGECGSGLGLDLGFLAGYYNMTVYRFIGLEHLLDANPAFTQRGDVKDEEINGNRIRLLS
jgi:hypothetical protein